MRMRAIGFGTWRTALGLTLAATLLAACDQKDQLGQPIPTSVGKVKLADILADPGAYKDQAVLLEGNYSSYCCASDFSYKEGVDAIEVAPAGFASPKAERGRPLRIYGVVRVGVRAEEEEEAESEEEEVHHGVYIEAKGVEFR